MGRHKDPDSLGRVEFLKAQILMTETGYPVSPSVAQDAYGVSCRAAPEEGWFWIPCTPQAARDIRRRGLRAVGTLTTTFIPRQMPVELDVSCTPDEIPIVGTQAHTELMLKETRARSVPPDYEGTYHGTHVWTYEELDEAIDKEGT